MITWILKLTFFSLTHIHTNSVFFCFFFSIWVFFHEHSRITGLQEKGEGIYLTPHYHFHPLHRHLDISRVITAESSPLHIGSSRTRIGNLWFPSTSCWPLSYAPLIPLLAQGYFFSLPQPFFRVFFPIKSTSSRSLSDSWKHKAPQSILYKN